MATRYWVGGTGTWNTTANTNWSATSGGAGGASIPTSVDDVVFDGNSNATGSNFALNSATFNAGTNTTQTLNSGVAPDGNTVATLITETVTSGEHYALDRSIAVTAGTVYTWSFYAKAYTGTARKAYVRVATAATASFLVDLTTGVGSGAGTNHISSGSQLLANGWVRCWVTFVAASTGNAVARAQLVRASDNASVYTGETTAGMYVWGAQFEKGFTATGYVPTSGTAVNTENNLLLYSEQFENTAWTTGMSNYTVTVNDATTTAPNGTTTADSLIVANGVSAFVTGVPKQTVTKAASAITYTHSIFAKAKGTTTHIRFLDYGATGSDNASTIVSLIDGSVVSFITNGAFSNDVSPLVIPMGNGWYRICFTYTTDTATTLTLRHFPYINSTPITGDGSSGLYVWGAQLEPGLTAGGYVPTTTAAVTNALSSISPFTVSILGTSAARATCRDFTADSLDGAMTVNTTSTSYLEVYGSFTLPSTNFAWTGTTSGTLAFKSTSIGKTITTNGVSITSTLVYYDGIGGEWTLGSAFTSAGNTMGLINGSLITNNYNVTCANFNSNNSNVRGLNLGSSIFTILTNTTGTWGLGTATNMTFNAGTSTIVMSGSNQTFNGGGFTYNDVSWTNTSITQTFTISGNNTYNNLTFANPIASSRSVLTIANNQTINGTLTLNSTNLGTARLLVQSTAQGNPITLSIANLTAMTDCDFRDINVTGAAAPISGARIGNLHNNTGIDFTPAKTVYWNRDIGGNWNATAWATSSGGTPDSTNFPLGQDTAIIENTGLNSGATVTLNTNWQVGNLDISSRTLPMTLAFSGSSVSFYGDIKFSSAVTTTASGGTLQTRATGITQNITTAGIAIAAGFNISNPNGTVKLLDNFNCTSTSGTGLNLGTLDLNNNTLSTYLFTASNSNTREINFGTGAINVTGNNTTVWTTTTGTNLTITGTPTVNFTYSGATGTRTILGPNSTTNTETNVVNFNITAGSDSLAFSGYRCKNINFTGFSGSLINAGIAVYGSVVFSPTMTVLSSANNITIGANTIQSNITSNNFVLNFPVTFNGSNTYQLQDNLTLATGNTLNLISGTLDLNNKTITTDIFTSATTNTRSIAFGTGKFICPFVASSTATTVVWDTSTSTNLTYTGTPLLELTGNSTQGVRQVKAAQGTVAVIGLNVTAGSDLVSLATTGGYFANVDFTGFAGTLSFGNSVGISGDFKLSPTMSVGSGTTTLTFNSNSGVQNITTFGKTIDYSTAIGGNTTFNLIDSLTIGATRNLTFTSGTLNLNNNTITTGIFTSSGSVARTLAFGTGAINVTGSNATVWTTNTGTNLTVTGTPTVNFTYSGATGTRTILGPNSTTNTETNVVDFNIIAGSDNITATSTRWKNVNFTGFSGIMSNPSIVIFGSLTVSPTMTPPTGTGIITIGSTNFTSNVTTNGIILDCPFNVNGANTVQLQDNLTLSNNRTFTLTSGTLDLNGQTLTTPLYTSNGSTIRSILFNNGSINLTGNNTTVWNMTTINNFTYTGTPTVNLTSNPTTGTRFIAHNQPSVGGNEAAAVNFNITSGSDNIDFGGSLRIIKNLNFTGYSGTLINSGYQIAGDLILSPTMTVANGTSSITFSGTSQVQNIATAGKVLDFPVTFSGTNTYILTDALTLSSNVTNKILTLNSGILDTNGKPIIARSANIGTSNTKQIIFSNNSITLSGNGTVWDARSANNFATTGNGTIYLTSANTKTFAGDSGSYPTLVQNGAGTLTISGNSTFYDLTTAITPTTITFTSGTINNFYNFNVNGTPNNYVTLNTSSAGNTARVNYIGTTGVNVDYLNISDLAAS